MSRRTDFLPPKIDGFEDVTDSRSSIRSSSAMAAGLAQYIVLCRALKALDELAEFFVKEIDDGMVESWALFFQNKVSNCLSVPDWLSAVNEWNDDETLLDGVFRRIRHLGKGFIENHKHDPHRQCKNSNMIHKNMSTSLNALLADRQASLPMAPCQNRMLTL